MKTVIKKLLREHLISEKLTNVDSDVDILYNKYFKDDVESIKSNGIVTSDMFKRYDTDTHILQSDDSVISNKDNPCVIKINYNGNYYQPQANVISVGINKNAMDFVISQGSLPNALTALGINKKSLAQEFTEEKIKGSIHHELAHWIDDTLHNKHITNRLKKASELSDLNLGGTPVNATKMEIQAQIHNIKQLYNKFSDVWDTLTFNDMIVKSPPLSYIYNQFRGDVKTKWLRDLKTRMYREGLLGKNMN